MTSSLKEGPSYYRGGSIQPVEYIYANKLDFLEGNVVKYITRWRDKNGRDDLLKARHYINMLLEMTQQGDSVEEFRQEGC